MKKLLLILLASFLITLIGCVDNDKKDPEIEVPDPDVTPPTQGTTFWWNDRVFYEIFVRSFYDSDGDGIGDIRGVIQKLDYLNDGDPNTDTDLGITGIWLMPIAQSPSYHGYDVVDYREIESDYGTNADFIEFMDEAHARGIKVVVDLVVNHTSTQHPWFESSRNVDSPYRDWYLWSDTDPGYNGPWGQQVWHPSGGDYYYGVFWGGMPDLNFGNEEVKDEIKDITRYWLEDMKVDGFRLDAAKHIIENGSNQENTDDTFNWWSEYNQFYKSVDPEAMTVGEVWTSTNIILNYLDDRLDYCFEFDLAELILRGVNNRIPLNIIDKMDVLNSVYPYHQYGTFLTNHDMNRVYGTLGQDLDKCRLAASVYLTLPGVPYLYYGEEVGMYGNKPDERIRTPMQWSEASNAGFTTGSPWQSLQFNYIANNVETMGADENSLWNRYRQLIQLRNKHKALSIGTYQWIGTNNDQLYAFVREHEGTGVLVVHNFSDELVENLELNVTATNLEEGKYNIKDGLSETEFDKLRVNMHGGIIEYTISEIGPRETLLLILE